MTHKEANALAWAEGCLAGLRAGRPEGDSGKLVENNFEADSMHKVLQVLWGIYHGDQPDLTSLFQPDEKVQ